MTELRTYVSLARDLRSGKLTPRAYLEECLDRIAKNEPRIGAFVIINADGARKAADASSARWRDGKPLSSVDGMPIAVKDVIETADMPTGQGSPMWEGNATRRNSAAVRGIARGRRRHPRQDHDHRIRRHASLAQDAEPA